MSFIDNLAAASAGAGTTAAVTTSAFAVGALAGLPLAAAARSEMSLVRTSTRLLIDFIRSIPPLAWLFIIFYGLAESGLTIDSFAAATAGLGLVTSAYMAEAYRSGLLAVPKGQWEAAAALGLSSKSALLSVVAPQAARLVVPTAAVIFIQLLKDSAIASVIGLTEITTVTLGQYRLTGDGVSVFAAAATLYILMGLPIAMLSRFMFSRAHERSIA